MNPVIPVKSGSEPGGILAGVPAPDSAQRAVTQKISQAVRQLNEVGYAGDGREITFSIDRATRLPVIKVVNINTKEVVEQWPAEYVLQLATDYVKSQRDFR